MIFQYQKIRCTRSEVDVHHRRQRSHRIVWRDHHVVRLRHRRDFLQLENSTGQADIRLHDIRRLLGHQLPEVVLGIQALTRGERNLHPLLQRLHRVHVLHADGLFEKVGMDRLQRLRHLRRANRLK